MLEQCFLSLNIAESPGKLVKNTDSWVPPQRIRSGRSLVGNLHFNLQGQALPLLPSVGHIISHTRLTGIYRHIKST